ncbi:MAG: transglutaminase family protein [Planctomycetes bacterium]|nr:transglutaminase family protein [Planctomycetota bacterium]
MRVRVKHDTRYIYGGKVLLGPQIVRLRPAEHARAKLLSYNLEISPKCEVRWQYDPWGNHIARLTFAKGTEPEEFRVTVDAAFDIRPVNPFNFFTDDRCKELPFKYPDGLEQELAPFLQHVKPSARLKAYVEQIPFTGNSTDYLVALNSHVAKTVRYIIRTEPGIQTSDETLQKTSGSCRDSAVLLVDCLRARGLAARFCSGYLVQLADEGNIPDVAKGVLHDVVDLHAWAEVFIPGAGWIGLDGTSGLLCGEGHIPLASTVNPELAAPIAGTSNIPAKEFAFEMTVTRLGHEPSPRKPYTEEQWAALKAAGERADSMVAGHGLRLTMGGEPTWTSREHPDLPEWNTEALGPTKWRQGLLLARELRKRFGVSPLAMQHMGKLYPGESLPRWVLRLLWRADDKPVWSNDNLLDLADQQPGTGNRVSTESEIENARRFGDALVKILGVKPNLIPGYEDPWVFLTREENLPTDIDPLKANLKDSEERRQLARALTRGLNSPVGFALPLRRASGAWQTADWTFRRRHCFLIPGDSPMGLRLPLDRIQGLPPEDHEADVTTPQPQLEQARLQREMGEIEAQAEQALDKRIVFRTAMCIEPRDGALNIFLPPVTNAQDFLDLISAIEEAAAKTNQPVRLEGYPPPRDPRLRECLVTPDPGVIEVNLPVSERFSDYISLMETVNDAANHAGLSTEKYQLDGRECGSGGGNHLTLGGPTTVESPFLQRPDLIASLLRFAQNHPSLSYLFTGLFVGPTSQAPRLDEARMDSLYELEVALNRLTEKPGYAAPWFTDRLLRNLLTDLSGNTHRTEFCIDKLYSPDGTHGRQGLVEFRAFEMPPHERMAAAQMLLVRSLAARFAKEPYTAPLVRWGSRLHDQFMLPHYLWRDFEDIARDLREHGLPLDAEWYRPFLDYRCPQAGQHQVDDLSIEIRVALEPWIVLGEQPTAGTVSRYVDSSVERLQVRVDGFVESRHAIAVNGWNLPLRATGKAGEGVAGLRFRAWQPPHCLQPHIGVHHPVRFDIVDLWSRRSLGAATYHVWHPEGRGFDKPPLTAFEAAARRAQRFTTQGHMPWPAEIKPTDSHGEQPVTLDLRRFDLGRRVIVEHK